MKTPKLNYKERIKIRKVMFDAREVIFSKILGGEGKYITIDHPFVKSIQTEKFIYERNESVCKAMTLERMFLNGSIYLVPNNELVEDDPVITVKDRDTNESVMHVSLLAGKYLELMFLEIFNEK